VAWGTFPPSWLQGSTSLPDRIFPSKTAQKFARFDIFLPSSLLPFILPSTIPAAHPSPLAVAEKVIAPARTTNIDHHLVARCASDMSL